jgi:hypothetical protein
MKKLKSYLADYCLYSDELAMIAFHMLNVMKKHSICVVIDRTSEKVVGVITAANFTAYNNYHFNCTSKDLATKSAADIMTTSFTSFNINDNYYDKANINFSKTGITDYPILDDDGYLCDIISLWQFRFREFYYAKKIPWMHYAVVLVKAALQAKKIGINRISAIEFGVCRGSSLTYAELIAIEIERLYDIQIDLYGFDLGTGLPATEKTESNMFKEGDFKSGDIEQVENRLRKAKMIWGDIAETAKTFLTPDTAPIGAMFVDVDIYSSAVSCLKLLDNDDKYFLPVISMYFDDIVYSNLDHGESQAIIEFNREHKNIHIAPEIYVDYNALNLTHPQLVDQWLPARIKFCFRYNHPKYSKDSTADAQLTYRI